MEGARVRGDVVSARAGAGQVAGVVRADACEFRDVDLLQGPLHVSWPLVDVPDPDERVEVVSGDDFVELGEKSGICGAHAWNCHRVESLDRRGPRTVRTYFKAVAETPGLSFLVTPQKY